MTGLKRVKIAGVGSYVKACGYLFPGQGAQFVGMGKELAESSPSAKAVFEKANETLGYDLARLCFEGPQDELTGTNISQPAIFTTSVAAVEALKERAGLDELPASATAGLSLGEYTALVFAGSLSFEGGLRLVHHRGTFMQKACDARPGTMAGIIGLPAAEVEAVVREVRGDGVLTVASYNSPEQCAVSGERGLVEKAAALATERGAKRAVVLSVAGAFHSALMDAAAEELIPYIRETPFQEPRIPFHANVTGDVTRDVEVIRECLIRQVNHPVRWVQSVEAMIASGVREFLEVGPGNVLGGLMRRTNRECAVTGVLSPDSMEAVARGD